METTKEDIGARITTVRKGLKWSQPTLGDHLGVSKQSVSGYENGVVSPTIEALAKIAEIGGVTLDWLITGKEPRRPQPRMAEQVNEAAAGWPTITRLEQEMVNKFRRCSAERQMSILAHIIEAEAESTKKSGEPDR